MKLKKIPVSFLFVRLVVWAFVIFVSFMGVLATKEYLWEGFQVPSSSMTPAFRIGDVVWVNKYVYGIHAFGKTSEKLPHRGDVIVFTHPFTEEYYVKRVVGLPGDSVMILGREVYVNGVLIENYQPNKKMTEMLDDTWGVPLGKVYKASTNFSDPYNLVFTDKKLSWRLSGFWFVPPKNLFVLGDLRDESSDSREWGFVPMKNLVGQAVCQIDAGYIESDIYVIKGRTGCSHGFAVDF